MLEKDISYYKKKYKDGQLDIRPLWACGPNADKRRYKDLEHIDMDEYETLDVNASALIKNADFLEVNPQVLFTGIGQNDSRVLRILSRWEEGYFIDPPEIGIRRDEFTLFFADGRHRTKVAYLLGEKSIPVMCYKSDLKKLKRILC